VKGEDIPSELHIPVDHTTSGSSNTFATQGTGNANPATVRLFIYSAHDTTLLALFTALEAISGPTDNKITPPYASSVVFELRKQSNGQLNVLAYYGSPTRQDNGEPATSPNGWIYVQDVLPLMCPSVSSPCTLSAWGAHVQTLTANVGSSSSGCCQIGTAFSQLGCNLYSIPVAQLEGDCMKYRTACPVSSCSGLANSLLSESTLACVPTSNSNSNNNNNSTNWTPQGEGYSSHMYKDYTIGLAVVSILLLLGLLGSILYFRNKLYLTSYGSLQQRMSHAQFV